MEKLLFLCITLIIKLLLCFLKWVVKYTKRTYIIKQVSPILGTPPFSPSTISGDNGNGSVMLLQILSYIQAIGSTKIYQLLSPLLRFLIFIYLNIAHHPYPLGDQRHSEVVHPYPLGYLRQ